MRLTQRLRGVLGTMTLWAVVFAAAGLAGLIPLAFLGVLPPFELSRFLRFAVNSAVSWGLGGAAMGMAFATAILLGERKRSFGALSTRRFAAFGFIAGALVPLGMATFYEITGHSSPAI